MSLFPLFPCSGVHRMFFVVWFCFFNMGARPFVDLSSALLCWTQPILYPAKIILPLSKVTPHFLNFLPSSGAKCAFYIFIQVTD